MSINNTISIFKYRARLFFVPLLARLGNTLGISYKTLGKKLGREVIIAQGRHYRPSDIIATSADNTLDIVFLTMIGGHSYNTAIDVTLASALRQKGHKVKAIVCDQQLPLCETKKANKERDWERACNKCWSYGKKLFQSYDIETIKVSEIIAKGVEQFNSNYDETVEASLLKHFGVGILENNEAVDTKRRLYEESAAKSQTIGNYLVNMSPDRVIMSHGIYCTWGPAREILNAAMIPLLTYGKTKKANSEKFNWTTGGDWWDVSNEWERVKEKPLTQEQDKKIQDYLASRRTHANDTLKYNFGEEESKSTTIARFGLDPNKQTFTLFTNVLWDAASAQREIAFKNPIDWVFRTIKWFEKNQHKQLLIKIHPAEVVIGTNQPMASIIMNEFSKLPANVKLIEPHETVNSWSILKVTDVGLVHTSTVGMELPLDGVPCVVVSRTHYRGKGFTIDVENSNSYFDLLENWDPKDYDQEKNRELAIRYAYLLFERYQLPFNVIVEPSHTNAVALTYRDTETLSRDKTINLIVSSIVKRTEFLLPENPSEQWN